MRKTDAYRAYLQDNNYVWGSNKVKTNTGQQYLNMLIYSVNAVNATAYQDAAMG